MHDGGDDDDGVAGSRIMRMMAMIMKNDGDDDENDGDDDENVCFFFNPRIRKNIFSIKGAEPPLLDHPYKL